MTIATSKDRTVFLFIRIVESFDFSFFFLKEKYAFEIDRLKFCFQVYIGIFVSLLEC